MEKNKNENLNKQIEQLKARLKEKDIKYKNLVIKNEQLKIEIDNEKKRFKDFQYKEANKDNLKSKYELYKRIDELYKIIDELKEKLARYPFELSKGEKLISVIFYSMDQKIQYSVSCKNTEIFIKLEEKLYREYPQYSDLDNFFMVNGKAIRKFKSLEENNIKNSDIIIVDQREF